MRALPRADYSVQHSLDSQSILSHISDRALSATMCPCNSHPMNDLPQSTEPVIIRLPAEIDVMNAEKTGWLLRSAFTSGGVVVADMTATKFCDSLGIKELLAAHHRASDLGCQLRFALPGGQVLRVLNLLRADKMLAIYPTVAEAVSAVRGASSNCEQQEGG
jgi:anti-sigma B factor antagonist